MNLNNYLTMNRLFRRYSFDNNQNLFIQTRTRLSISIYCINKQLRIDFIEEICIA
jgi:hypothetical protein